MTHHHFLIAAFFGIAAAACEARPASEAVDSPERSCPLDPSAYETGEGAQSLTLQILMPDGETVDVEAKTESLISLTHGETGQNYTFRVSADRCPLTLEMFEVTKKTGQIELTEIIEADSEQKFTSAQGLQFYVVNISDDVSKYSPVEPAKARGGECCFRCSGWLYCCTSCCACLHCCRPQ